MNQMQVEKKKRVGKHVIPNVATVFNMFLGFLALGYLVRDEPVLASWLILVSIFFDSIDGKLARLLGISSRFGTEFDSLADTVSFCVVPSVMVYLVYGNGLPPVLRGMICFIPLLFGTIRLARFNVLQTEKPVPYFTGLTTPLNALLIVSFMLFNHQIWGDAGDPRIALVMISLLGFLMVSPVRFSKFPLLSFRQGKKNTLRLVALIAVIISMVLWRGIILFPVFSLYIIWSIFKWMLDNNRFEEDGPMVESEQGVMSHD
ncbi:MAG: CDP-diacylglycerol--serine O-phosphatidyltransferase [Candidatus Marinimicrobia bacterium]|mgnify:FL=1|jgi:CDP-diacylglycerol--serine O-phosphatidyltransferase|nr:CDP-diacylglycerol--serine O-phosphatidyltransferase [Candidatus Neomarinimicrobiota bacterium]MBT3618406.1 CDP-diacylglycerol--serine O-phosphatidyltransferase [Candidatus Neomarinimicrobiota bacterium]MBT3829201.1 CDP-diacylglycerol--serine O-phosphatidyltransferase [Candidatus Neomarinimicrobiota bacterium]MBT3998169.1 CDP-diacylglycerol--serine O-phosphatidyltransferase [Candidatus Neomarinimicrobiota bacterium]MBT4281510.1 CDP-diacylglycerol--serine O-phosphatidyltransferase [Candidatus